MKSFVMAASGGKILQYLTPQEYSDKRYSAFKESGKAPEETFEKLSHEFDERSIGKLVRTTVFTEASFEYDGDTFFKLCKKPKPASGLLYAQN